jgi:hypothetical protein
MIPVPLFSPSIPKRGLVCDYREYLGSTQGILNKVVGGTNLTLGTGGHAPSWVTGGLSFDGTASPNNDYCTITSGYTNFLSTIANASITIAISPYQVDNYALICTAANGATGLELQLLNNNRLRFNYNSGQSNSAGTDYTAISFILTLVKVGTSATAYINGVSITMSGVLGATLTLTDSLKVGGTSTDTNPFRGTIYAGPIIHQVALNANEIKSMHRYLASQLKQYGVSITV